jgi:hypothetical protein
MRTHFAIATRTGASENGPQPTSTTTEETDAARIDRWKAENTENAAQAHVNTKSLQPGGGLRLPFPLATRLIRPQAEQGRSCEGAIDGEQ